MKTIHFANISAGPLAHILRRFAGYILALSLLCLSSAASAHPAPFSYLDLHLDERRIDGLLTVHVIDLAHEMELDEPAILLDQGVLLTQYGKIGSVLQERFRISGGELAGIEWKSIEAVPGDDAVRMGFSIAGSPPSALHVQAQLFPYDPAHQTFVNIYEGDGLRQQWIFAQGDAPRTYFAGTTAGVFAVLGTFIPSGVEHIMIGPDHILFIIGLILLGGSWRRLAVIVTSFTIGHSVTLSLAALDMVMVPSAVIEPLIALSIIVVGADNLLRGEGRDFRTGIAFVFGLIHGFGFAYVLRQFGLPDTQLAWSLFSFNLGVEIGQLAIVLVVAVLMEMLRRRSEKAARQVATIGSLAVMAAGAYWFAERVFFTGAG